jgi:hypothetical protein
MIDTTQQNTTKKESKKTYDKTYHNDNKLKIKLNQKNYYETNKEQIKNRQRAYYNASKLKIKQVQQNYRENNKEKIKLYQQFYYNTNKEQLTINQQKWCIVNKERIKAHRNTVVNKEKTKLRINNRYKTDPLYRFRQNLRGNSRRAFKRIGQNKSAKTETLLGCSWQEAKEHFERLFQPGMNWANHGFGKGCWHIDHKIPIASAMTMEDAIKLNHISNLQPLWSEDNFIKGAKV